MDTKNNVKIASRYCVFKSQDISQVDCVSIGDRLEILSLLRSFFYEMYSYLISLAEPSSIALLVENVAGTHGTHKN